jgi:hypothetical protein
MDIGLRFGIDELDIESWYGLDISFDGKSI